MELNTKNKAVACLQIANDLCQDVRFIGGSPHPKPWHTDGKVQTQSKLIRKVFDILHGGVEVTSEESEQDVVCLKIAYDLCNSITTVGAAPIGPANTDQGAITRAELIRSIFDILHDQPSDLSIFDIG